MGASKRSPERPPLWSYVLTILGVTAVVIVVAVTTP